jgi:methionyl-tRNA formyltransferase
MAPSPGAPTRIIFIGAGDIGLPALRWLLSAQHVAVPAVVTQPDRPAGRSQELRAPAVKSLATAAGIPVLQPAKLRSPEAVAELAALRPAIIVVMAYGQILPRAVLAVPSLACLNLHASLLPRHRGASPIQAAIAAGDTETGITVMHMAEGLDTGDILLAKRLPIAPDETGGSLHDRLAELAPVALACALDQLRAGTASRIPQDESLATYAKRLGREDGRLDWSLPAAGIERTVRAMNPWPAASTALPLSGGGFARVKIFHVETGAAAGAAPGTILGVDADGISVAAADRVVRLVEIQGEGGRRMRAGDWARGHAVAAGGLATP